MKNFIPISNKSLKHYIFYICLSAPLWYISFSNYYINSDLALDGLAANAITEGNIFLKNWIIGNDNFYTCSYIWQAPFALFIKNMPQCLYAFFTLTICFLYIVLWLLADCRGKFSLSPEIFFSLTTIIFIALGPRLAVTNWRGPTILLSLYSVLFLFHGQSWPSKIIFILFASFALAGDLFTLSYLFFPLLFTIYRYKHVLNWRLLLYVISILPIAFIIRKFLQLYGFNTPFVSISIITFTKLSDIYINLQKIIEAIFIDFNASIWGLSPLSTSILLPGFNLCLLLLIAGSYWHYKKYENHTEYFLFVSNFTVIYSLLFSNLSYAGKPIYHFLTPFFINAIPLTYAFTIKSFPILMKKSLGFITVIFIFIFMIVNILNSKKVIEIEETKYAAEWLLKKGHKHGIGNFWASNTVAFYANGQITIGAVAWTGHKYMPYLWMTNKDWYKFPATFMIIDIARKEGEFNPDNIIKSFGNPADVVEIGRYKIFTFENAIYLIN